MALIAIILMCVCATAMLILNGDKPGPQSPTYSNANVMEFLKRHLDFDIITHTLGDPDTDTGKLHIFTKSVFCFNEWFLGDDNSHRSLGLIARKLRESHFHTFQNVGVDISKQLTLQSSLLLQAAAVPSLQLAVGPTNGWLTWLWNQTRTLLILSF